MFRTIAMKSSTLALLLASAVVGVAEAQPPGYPPSGYCTGGLSTLTGNFAKFYVTLDDYSSEPGILVVMRFINQAGTVVKSRTVNIGPGASAMLEYRGAGGLYRVQAEIFEPSGNISPSARRAYLASQESQVTLVQGFDEVAYRLIGPGPLKVQCTPTAHTQ